MVRARSHHCREGITAVTVAAKLVEAKNGHVAVLTNSVGGVEVLESIQLDNLSLVIGSATALASKCAAASCLQLNLDLSTEGRELVAGQSRIQFP